MSYVNISLKSARLSELTIMFYLIENTIIDIASKLLLQKMLKRNLTLYHNSLFV